MTDKNYDPKHQTNPSSGTPQGPETGGNLQRVPADSAPGTAIARALPYRESDYIGEVEFIGLREISYARACRSPSAVLCASTDAGYAARAASEAEIREFIHDTFTRCLARIYYRSDPREIRKVVDGTEDPS